MDVSIWLLVFNKSVVVVVLTTMDTSDNLVGGRDSEQEQCVALEASHHHHHSASFLPARPTLPPPPPKVGAGLSGGLKCRRSRGSGRGAVGSVAGLPHTLTPQSRAHFGSRGWFLTKFTTPSHPKFVSAREVGTKAHSPVRHPGH